jgi:basic membrane lipoprotein Med (substrate-binding protein (PBP1-ABC) superfamily)
MASGLRRFGLALALAAVACGPASEPQSGAGAPPLRVALLTPGSVADGGWNQGAYEGLLLIRDELGAEISHAETRTPAEFEDGFRDYAARHFDLVFGHGFEYQEAAARVGAEYPDTTFVTTSGSTVRAGTSRPSAAPFSPSARAWPRWRRRHACVTSTSGTSTTPPRRARRRSPCSTRARTS